MREIKFRGQRVDNSEWVYGDLKRVSDNRIGGEWYYIWVDSDDIELSGEYSPSKSKSVG